MKRLAVALALVALTGALVFPSAAAPFSLTALDPVSNDVLLAPANTPNGDYAYLDENDELVVDLSSSNPNVDGEGLNPNAVTGISDVFVVHYNGSQYAHVWLTHESEDVTFTARGQPIQSEANNVTLEPNESVAVGLAVDTTGETTDGLIDDITVHAKVAEPPSSGGGGGTGGEPVVQVLKPDSGTAEVTVVGANAGQPTTVGLDALELDGPGLTLDEVTVVPSDDSEVSAEIRTQTDANASAFTVSDTQRLGEFTVEHDASAPMERVTFRFSVASSYLDSRDIDPATFTVYRQPDGADDWTALETEVVRTGENRVQFEAESPGFSTFVVGLPSTSDAPGTTASDVDSGESAPDDVRTDTSSDEQAADGANNVENSPAAADELREEQAASTLERVLGVVALLAIVASLLTLVRRVSR